MQVCQNNTFYARAVYNNLNFSCIYKTMAICYSINILVMELTVTHLKC